MTHPQFTAVVLAAGKGTRMKSPLPKVLHDACGRSMAGWTLKGLGGAGVSKVRMVVGHGADLVQERLSSETQLDVSFHLQKEQLGTGHAVLSANLDTLDGAVFICNGDHPLIGTSDYTLMIEEFQKAQCDLMIVGVTLGDPHHYGRIVKNDQGQVLGIVEYRDATEEQRAINEVNPGIYLVKAEVLKKYLPQVSNENDQKEYYLTDIVGLALKNQLDVKVFSTDAEYICHGVNDQVQMAEVRCQLKNQINKRLMEQGVVFVDPDNTYIDDTVEIGAGTKIEPGSVIKGKTKIGTNCVVEGNCRLEDAVIGDSVHLRWGTIIEKSEVRESAIVGPYGRLRPDSLVEKDARVGNFVELKKARLGVGAKANHLTYLGDADVGDGTNIGCGTITCNYAVDKKKYKTTFGKNAFIGSDTQFVAPVNVGDGAVVASGSTITKDVPSKALAVARGRQKNIENYVKE